uniref:cannabinoid receptor type 1B-like n=1 Tax=Styela clava TaxID=7725 RepID=UPI001939647B|nr:cannabinoid receptor type 1B-like [Styela clava]
MKDSIATTTHDLCKSWEKEVLGQFQVLIKDPALRLSVVWCAGAIGLVVICMNFLVICSIIRAKNLRHNSVYIFVFSMAVADLLAAVVFLSIFLRFHLTKDEQGTDDIPRNSTVTELYQLLKTNDRKLQGYLIQLMMVTTCFTASVGSLVLTAVDRFIAVVKPFEYHSVATRKRCVFAVVLMWAISILVSSLPVAGWRCSFGCQGFPKHGCSQLYPGISRGYLTFYVIFIVFLLVFVTSMYIYIFTVVWKHYKYNCAVASKQKKYLNYPSSTWPRTKNTPIKMPANHRITTNLNAPTKPDIQSGRRTKILPGLNNCPCKTESKSSQESSLYELEMINCNPQNTSLEKSRSGSRCYELRKESFRFVLIVEEENDEEFSDFKREKERATSFRGFLFYGNTENSTPPTAKSGLDSDSKPTISPIKPAKRRSSRFDFKRNRHQMQIIQTLILILGILIICWVPSLTFMILDLLMNINKDMKKVFAFLALLTLLNSAANPVVYAIRLKELRGIASTLLCCLKRPRQR